MDIRATPEILQFASELPGKDIWISPVYDDLCDDYNEWCDLQRSGWEETCQFDHSVKAPLWGLCVAHCESQGLSEYDLDDKEQMIEMLYCEILPEFWDAWHRYYDTHNGWKDRRSLGSSQCEIVDRSRHT